jgi:hypothetical protein
MRTLALFAAVVVAYFPCIPGPALFDDVSVLRLDPDVLTFFGLLPAPAGSVVTPRPLDRPLTVATFAAVHHLFGAGALWAQHLVNIALHGACAVLLARLAEGASAGIIGLAAAALFALHPAFTQAVAYISQRGEPLALLFALLAVHAWRRGRSRWLLAALCLCGMLSKPQFAAFPPALLVLDRLLRDERKRYGLRKLWPSLATLAVPMIMLLRLPAERAAEIGAGVVSPLTYFLTQMEVLARYLGILALAVPATPDPAVEWATRLTAPMAAGLAVWLAAWVGLAGLLRSKAPARGPFALFVLGCWLFIWGLAPTSSLIPIADPMMVHRLYFPAGLALLAWIPAAEEAYRRVAAPRLRRGLAAVALGATALLAVLTWRSAALWNDAVAMNSHVVAHNPGSSRAHRHLAVAYGNADRYVEALSEFESALKLATKPRDARLAREGTATTLARMQRFAESAAVVEGLVGENPGDWYHNQLLGQLYLSWARQAFLAGELARSHSILDKCEALKAGDGPRDCGAARRSIIEAGVKK